MFYEYSLTIPAATAKAAYASADAPLSPGAVSLVSVQFPTGCAGLVHAAVYREDHQVWPVNLDGDISSDGQSVSWPEQYEIDDEPMAFILRGWAPSSRFPHTVTFRFALLPLELAAETRALPGLLRSIGRFLGVGA